MHEARKQYYPDQKDMLKNVVFSKTFTLNYVLRKAVKNCIPRDSMYLSEKIKMGCLDNCKRLQRDWQICFVSPHLVFEVAYLRKILRI